MKNKKQIYLIASSIIDLILIGLMLIYLPHNEYTTKLIGMVLFKNIMIYLAIKLEMHVDEM